MRVPLLLIAATITLLATITGCKERPIQKVVNGNTWELAWSEDFNGNEIDTAIWSKIPRGNADWKRHMSDYDSLYQIADGTVILHAINNHTQTDDTAKYITGGIFTKNKKDFGYGRIEIRAKFTSAQGFWPALWLLPTERRRWPDGGEIDIMEHLNHDTIAYQTVHTPYTLSRDYVDNPPKGCIGTIDKEAYNIYAVERYPDSICFYINDTKYNTYPRIDSLETKGQFPFNNSNFYLLMDSQLGGSWVGEVDATQLPAHMTIDWVQYYQQVK